MPTSLDLPAVSTQSMSGGVEATAALTLTSVVSSELISSGHDQGTQDNQELFANQWESRQQLMQALAIWPDHTTLELHWTVHPDIQHPTQGQLWVNLVIRTLADGNDAAIKGALQGFFRLRPLLETHLTHMTFSPIIQKKELQYRLHPFDARYAMTIGRLKRCVALSNPMPKTSIGYSRIHYNEEPGSHVDLCYPWSPAICTSNHLARALLALWDPIQLVVRLTPYLPKEDELQQLENQIIDCERFLSAGKRDQVTFERQVSMIRDRALLQLTRIGDAAFSVNAFMLSNAQIDTATAGSLAQLILAPTAGQDGNHLFVGGHTVTPMNLENTSGHQFPAEMPVSCKEAAAIFALPMLASGDSVGLPVRRWRTCANKISSGNGLTKQSIVLFDHYHQDHLQPVYLSNEDRMRHMFVVGATGTGKSVLLTNMILQDIARGHGVCVIDPHGDMVEWILSRIPEQRSEDVILFDVLDERPVGFNLLEWYTLDERDTIIDALYQTVDYLYDMKHTGGPIFEHHFRSMFKLLCGDGTCPRPNFFPTVLEFIRCYLEEDMRKWLFKRTSEMEVKDFIRESERTNSGDIQMRNIAPYITSKFGRFTTDTKLRKIFGQDTTSFSFDDILQQGKIFLVKLGRGRCGPTVSSLLASQLVARFKIAAMKRGSKKETERKDFFLYIDEAGLIPPDSVGDLLSEARKYHLGVVLSTQYTKQLSTQLTSNRKDTLLDSVIGNVGAMIAMRLGLGDAQQMASNFWPEFSVMDIVRLPNYHGYARIQQASQPSHPSSFRTRPLSPSGDRKMADHIRKLSQERYGSDPLEVEAQIQRRRRPWLAEEKTKDAA